MSQKLFVIEHKLTKMETSGAIQYYECSCGLKELTPDKVKDHLIEVQRHRIADLLAILDREIGLRKAADREVEELRTKLHSKGKGLITVVGG